VPADAYREEVRKRLAKERGGEKRDREAVNDASWEEMWEIFKPLVEQAERQNDSNSTVSGCPENVDPFLDPDYHETDPGRRLRDSLLWNAEEIRRVVSDTTDGTVIHLERAKTKPPTAWAVFYLESLAAKPLDKRGTELVSRVMPFAYKIHDPSASGCAHQEDGYLDSLE